MFIDRNVERKQLNEALDASGFGFVVLYGRRRIGKTALVLECVKEREHFYYLAVEKNNLPAFATEATKRFPDAKNVKEDWEALLDYLKDRVRVLIIDEFQNLFKEDPAILSLFQRAVDTNLSKSRLKLVILGSSTSIMTSDVLSQKSPLYARKTMSTKLEAMRFPHITEFFPGVTASELVEIYGFAGGTPYYLQKIKPPFWQWLDAELKQPTFIKDEVSFLMRYEFNEPGTYKTILEAIANGKTTVKEIKDYARLLRTDVSPYLSRLAETDFIERRLPITENVLSKNGRYYIKDQFTAFWFKFIYPNLSSIEAGIYPSKAIAEAYPQYLGHVFESICTQHLATWIQQHDKPYQRIGKWWHRDQEIDAVALNPQTHEILLAECKYKENLNAETIASELSEKTQNLDWHEKKRKEALAVYAKSFSKKITQHEEHPVYCFDLKDLTRTGGKTNQTH